MTAPVVLIRDDTLAELVLDGCVSIERARDGSLTRHAVPDRTYVVDGITVLPAAITLEVIVSPNPTVPGLTTGRARITEVMEWLDDARRAGITLALQEEGRTQDTDLVVERWTERTDRTDSPRLSIWLGEIRVAETLLSTLEATVAPRRAAPSPSETAKDGEEESEGGNRSFLAIGADGLSDAIERFFGASP